ncbi:phosphoglycerate kinase [Candidatus Puniceispirillum sp.]|uniref:phosphoglycerate kinase n=1 Tax=Candidatus Puniceispirillum sp. TaxID=2026719 RepID=UPI003F69A7F5
MTAPFLFADELDVKGKRVLLRLDLNVPVQDGKVSEDTRIRRILPGLKDMLAAGAAVIILTHFGRPKGKVMPEFSVQPIADCMAKLIGKRVTIESDVIGAGGKTAAAGLKSGQILMMENLRFFPGEEANDADFAAALAALGDIYVGDAFSCTHRAHASVEALPKMMKAAAGRALGAELTALESALANPKRPVAALVGGAKVSTKLDVLNNLVTKVDGLILGGGMANTFLLAKGFSIGASLAEPDMVDIASAIIKRAEESNCKLILPDDALVAGEFKAGAAHRIASIDTIEDGDMILDAGPKSIASAIAFLATCSTVVWNGPMGAFEIPPFDTATNAIAKAVGIRSAGGSMMSVAGGGDTLAALANAGVSDQFSYISTAGGAFLEWLEGKTLPGVEALRIN